ncbi:MAG: GNAT family N-acetyltransferase [Ardenticatenaceae bacterium]|nr:GNAT family N-acetyltransferase [Ardenticatenaceae bacterium]HBY97392.1 GNAT family N-acetyltransferase [Chloroflexota bacterium]
MPAPIRPATVSDIPAIQEVARRTWTATYAGMIPEATQAAFLERAYSREELERRLAHPAIRAWVAGQDGRVVGYLFLHLPEDLHTHVPELAAIYVLPEAQGRGFGLALFEAAVQAVRTAGASVLWVVGHRDNHRSRSWYERRGFVYDHDTVAWQSIPEAVYRLEIAG